MTKTASRKTRFRWQFGIRALLFGTASVVVALWIWIDTPRRIALQFKSHLISGDLDAANEMLTGGSKFSIAELSGGYWLNTPQSIPNYHLSPIH